MMAKKVFILGSFVADVAFRSSRLPAWGETLMGTKFKLGPGGKGSNQAVAAARALAGSGNKVQFLSKLGDDAFGQLARDIWSDAGVDASLTKNCTTATGAAAILIDDERGENAIIVVPGACFTLTAAEVEEVNDDIRGSDVFLTQLELPLSTVERGLELARAGGVPTILNPAPAPAHPLPDAFLALSDYIIPNETEAAILTGLPVENLDQAKAAAKKLQSLGARNIVLTLGSQGALVLTEDGVETIVPSFHAGPVVETTGAGDAFCGGFAAALAEGQPLLDAVRFGCATAGISVTRHGAAPAMPKREEIDALLG
jgi:ribokinase